MKTICIGKLSNINPFNQPAVEQLKNLQNNYLIEVQKLFLIVHIL